MNTFNFRTVPNIICQAGATQQLGEIIHTQFPDVQRVLLVTDAGFLKTGLVDPAINSLQQHDIETSLFTDVVADPPENVVLQAAQFARSKQCQAVIGIGGGSSLDVAKLIAVLAASDQPLNTMYGINQVKGQRLPLIQIPTTAGTGSEVTPISIITTGRTSKMGVVAPQLYADMAILDATLTTGLPAKITAATGIDAMVHAIEAYTTKHKKNPLSDMLAKQALQLLWNHIETACSQGDNLVAREAMLLGAMLAGQAFANAPCAAVHALAYPIGGIFHVPHGLSNSLVLPHVLRFNAAVAMPQYAELAEIICPNVKGDSKTKCDAVIQALQDLAVSLKIETQLRQVGITEQDLEQLSKDAILQTRLLSNNPRELRYEDAYAIYQQAL